MRIVIVVLLALAALVNAGDYPGGVRPSSVLSRLRRRDIFTGAHGRPAPTKSRDQLPKQLDWCNYSDGKSYCTASWNQHIPSYCGSCYVHGSLAAANDRIKIQLNGKHDVLLARQVILNCGAEHGLGHGCMGGEAYDIFEYMHRYGLPDESCQNYEAKVKSCTAEHVCQNCMPVGEDISVTKCWAVPKPILYFATQYGEVAGELEMMSEIEANGPITCGFASTPDFDYNYRGGIYHDHTNASRINHDVEVVGWGEENGVKYWKARNSWGTYWGENSFFRIVRGINNMQFESTCVFAHFSTKPVERVLNHELEGGMYGLRKEQEQSQPQPQAFVERSPGLKALDDVYASSERDSQSGSGSGSGSGPTHQAPEETESADSEGPAYHPSKNNDAASKKNDDDDEEEEDEEKKTKGKSKGKGKNDDDGNRSDLDAFLRSKGLRLPHQGHRSPSPVSFVDPNQASAAAAAAASPAPSSSSSSDNADDSDNAKWVNLVNEYKQLVHSYADAYKTAYQQGKADAESEWKRTSQTGSDIALGVGQRIHDIAQQYKDENGVPFVGKPSSSSSPSLPSSSPSAAPLANVNLNEAVEAEAAAARGGGVGVGSHQNQNQQHHLNNMNTNLNESNGINGMSLSHFILFALLMTALVAAGFVCGFNIINKQRRQGFNQLN